MVPSTAVQSTAISPMSSSQSPVAVSAPGVRPVPCAVYRPRTARTPDHTTAAAAAPARALGCPSVRRTSQAGIPRPKRSKPMTSGRYRPGLLFGPGRSKRSRCTVGPCRRRSKSWRRGRCEGVRGRGAPASPTGPDISDSGSSTCPMNPPVTVALPQTGRIRRSCGLTDAPSLGARYPHTCHFAGVPVKFRQAVRTGTRPVPYWISGSVGGCWYLGHTGIGWCADMYDRLPTALQGSSVEWDTCSPP